MHTRRETCLKIAHCCASGWLTAIFGTTILAKGDADQGGTQALSVPFRFASGRASLLIQARVDRRAALLIVDTGSSHTILRPSIAGVNPVELAAPLGGAGFIGDAVGKQVSLEVGQHVSQRRVSVMDLSNVLSAYQEKIDGLLGMDFFLEFSQTVINLKARTITFVP